MTINFKTLCLFIGISSAVMAQNDTIKLAEVSVSSNRISLPFSNASRTITLITSDDIIRSSATNVADLLQNVAGIDIRRRGTDGMQSDLYIRGGNFDQTLLLIDGVKMDDAQTGHHSMNAMLSLENIQRIEIIKGPAARVYGHNAFTGAVNIVTKKVVDNALDLQVNYGSYKHTKASLAYYQNHAQGTFQAHTSYQQSDGYRFNTDFTNLSAFVKGSLGKQTLTASFASRKFGANGFYASPDYKDQYEETETSLVAFSGDYQAAAVRIKPRVYWRRNQDTYLFLRHDPSYYKNVHIANKAGAETNIVIHSALGKTGLGLDLARVFLVSNNLGDHQRTVLTGFLEHRFELLDRRMDITPGIAISSYSDFDTKAFPGLDIGYRISAPLKLYGNIGYTYRVPTYTDLYYVGPTTQGNAELQPESALSEELGLHYVQDGWQWNLAVFNRSSDNLIDWTKAQETDKWQVQNFSKVVTQGMETSVDYRFYWKRHAQKLSLSYSYIDDQIKDETVAFTRYSLNSIKHQFNTGLHTRYTDALSQHIAYRFVERTDGERYGVLDASLRARLAKGMVFSLVANNLLNAEYTETNMVPMPKANIMLGLKYRIY